MALNFFESALFEAHIIDWFLSLDGGLRFKTDCGD